MAIAAATVPNGCASIAPASERLARCIWVSRYDWKSRADIERIVGACADAGFTAILFQVRGNGTAYWSSGLEVWSEAFGFHRPDFDPLQTALAAAHARGLQLHAWMNMVPGWKGGEPPADPRQLWSARPSWFARDAAGAAPRLAPGAGYHGLDPSRADVRRYLASLCREVVERYAVDGIHLDYVRTVDEDPVAPAAAAPAAVAPAEAAPATAAPGVAGEADDEHVTAAVTQLVREVRAALDAVPTPAGRRRPLLSAAVFADLDRARRLVHQDWPTWARQGLVDVLLPMNYEADDQRFRARAAALVRAAGDVPVVMGVGAYRHDDPAQTARQVTAALDLGAAGVALLGTKRILGDDPRWRDALARVRVPPRPLP